MSDPILSLPVAGINISTFGEDSQLSIGINGASVYTWPQHCTLMEPLSKGTWPCLRVESADHTVSFMMLITDPAEAEQLAGVLDALKETP